MTINDSGVCSTYLDPWLSFVCEVEDDVIRKICGMLDTCPKFSSINQGRLTPAISFYRVKSVFYVERIVMLNLLMKCCDRLFGHVLQCMVTF